MVEQTGIFNDLILLKVGAIRSHLRQKLATLRFGVLFGIQSVEQHQLSDSLVDRLVIRQLHKLPRTHSIPIGRIRK